MESKNKLHKKVLKFENIIDYQKGSIVSRTVIDKDTGTITVFAFDKDEFLSEHTAPFDAVVSVIDGSVEVTISGEVYKLSKGQTIIMPAEESHSLKAIDKFKMVLTMIKS